MRIAVRLMCGLTLSGILACAADRVIGLLVLPEVFGGEACVEFAASDVAVHRAPGGKPTGALRVKTPWRALRDGGCGELVVEYRGERGDRVLEATQEYGYEMRAAVVFEARAGWYRVDLGRGESGWVAARSGRRFLDLKALFRELPLSAAKTWDGVLYNGPRGAEVAKAPADRTALAARALEILEVGGGWWMRVVLPVENACGESVAGVRREAWVKIHGAGGAVNFWFHSRGC